MMPKRKAPPEKPKDQFKRFVEVAKERGVDEAGRGAEAAFRKLAASKKTTQK